MSNFKVGDKVVVRKGQGMGGLLPDGAVTEITSVHSDGFVCVGGDPSFGFQRDSARFELFEAAAAKVRPLKGDVRLVFEALCDGISWTVQELRDRIEAHTHRKVTDATITARIRDLRKQHFGGFRIDRIQQGKRHFYKLVK